MSDSGTFSFYYDRDGNGGVLALDWSWLTKGVWTASMRDGVEWCPCKETDEKTHAALLEKFGLEDYADEFSLERIRVMPPVELALERRAIETDHGLDRLEMRSDTVGYDVLAEDHG